MDFKTKDKIVKINDLKNKDNTLTPSSCSYVKTNGNTIPLKSLINKFTKGIDLSETDFFNFKTDIKYFKTASLTGTDFLLNDINKNAFEYVNKGHKKESFIKKDTIIYTSTGSNTNIGDCSITNKDMLCNFSSHIYALDIKENLINKFYLFAILNSQYGKDFCDVLIPNAGIMRRGGDRFLDIEIPLPTKKNNNDESSVEIFVELLTKNIIDKEEKIKEKRDIIDTKIEEELKTNSKPQNYSFPSIKEIKSVGRFDSGVYKESTQYIKNLLTNYKNGFYTLKQHDILGGNTPKKRIMGKGCIWLTPTDCKKGVLNKKSLIKSQSYNIYETSILISNRSNVCDTVLFYKDDFERGQYNQGMYKLDIKNNFDEGIFILNIFNSDIFQKYIMEISTGSTFNEIRASEIEEYCFIPNFNKKDKDFINKNYFCKIDKINHIDKGSYLKKELERNKEIGIYQLNMELFELKKILNTIIQKIVKNEYIDINLNY